MRDIKFRAWNGKLKIMYSAEEMAEDQMTLLPTGQFINVNGTSTRLSVIYPSDVMLPLQFTGLLDCNGREIYDGDIVNSLYRKDGCKGLYEVQWNEGAACFSGIRHGTHQQINVFITPRDWTRCEVIGSIYTHPELLTA